MWIAMTNLKAWRIGKNLVIKRLVYGLSTVAFG
jgi:hypothetical protein